MTAPIGYPARARRTEPRASVPHALDHVFVLARPGAPEADRLVALGLTEGSPATHPGQGTANRRFFLEDGMLELLFGTGEAGVGGALVAPTRLAERAG